MSGAGLYYFGTGPFGTHSPDSASLIVGQIVASRRFDANGNPVQTSDGSGSFEGVSDNLSRARIALLKSRPRTKIITATFETDERKRVDDALRFLTASRPPLIEIVSVNVFTSGSTGMTTVDIRDLSDGTIVKVDASPRHF
jgi:hypothetical protein